MSLAIVQVFTIIYLTLTYKLLWTVTIILEISK